MALYLVCLPEDKVQSTQEKLEEKSKSRDLDFIHLWGGVFLVMSRRSSMEIARQLEIAPSGLGIVSKFQIEFSAGRARGEVIQWLRAREES